jgi:phosphotransferase system HPr (HPr) family protein
MFKKEIVLKKDLKGRAAAQIVEKIRELKYSYYLIKDDRKANLQSLVGTLSLGLKYNDKVSIVSNIDNIDIIISILKEEGVV